MANIILDKLHLLLVIRLSAGAEKEDKLSATKLKAVFKLKDLGLVKCNEEGFVFLTEKGIQLLSITLEQFNDVGHNL